MNKKLNTERLTRETKNVECENAVGLNRLLYAFLNFKEIK